MDAAWAQERLEKYLELCNRLKSHQKSNGHEWDDYCSQLTDEAELQLPAVEKIVRAAYPTAPHPLMSPNYPNHDSEQWVRRALGAIRDEADIATHLQPESPMLAADQLHPRVWESAALVWDTGEYSAALQQASITLSAYIRAKAGSPLRDRKLVAEVFSPNLPRVGANRLQFPGDPADEAWLARQHGLHLVAQGVFAGIRNIAAHEEGDWNEQEALELLAMMSTIARWTDETELRASQEKSPR